MLFRELTPLYERHVLSKLNTNFPKVAAGRIELLLAFFGHLDVSRITPERTAAYTAFRRKGEVLEGRYSFVGGQPVKDSTIRAELMLLRTIINNGVKLGVVERPADFGGVPKGSAPRDVWLTDREKNRVLEAARAVVAEKPDRWWMYLAIAIMLATGCRPNVVQRLRWRHVDLRLRILDCRNEEYDTRNKKYGRVRISRELSNLLAKEYLAASEFTSDDAMQDVLVLGQYRNLESMCTLIRRRSGVKKFRPYIMRHTWATMAMRDGVPLHAAAQVLGCSVFVVDKRYAHHSPEFQKSAIDERKPIGI